MSPKTACFLIIGNEILSGRTQDTNTRTLAYALNKQGIKLSEIRVIPDDAERIINTVIDCRSRFHMVFTSGGIGPTHDDITTHCIAEAFGVALERHDESFSALQTLFKPENFNEARQKMAWLPAGSTPIKNSISIAPGFSLGNIHVMAGVPSIFCSMVEWLIPQFSPGTPLSVCSWYSLKVYEGDIAKYLTALQERFKTLDLGSYPFEEQSERGVALVAKGYEAALVEQAGEELKKLLIKLGTTPIKGDPRHLKS